MLTHTFENRSKGPGERSRLTPPTNAARGRRPFDAATPSLLPSAERCKHACLKATRDDEHAVSMVMLGPAVPNVKDSLFASIDDAAPVLRVNSPRSFCEEIRGGICGVRKGGGMRRWEEKGGGEGRKLSRR